MTQLAESLMPELADAEMQDTHQDRRLSDERLTGHEALCLVRHDTLLEMIQALGRRMGRLETVIVACAGTLIVGMAVMLWWAFQQFAALVIHVPSAGP